MGRGRRELSSWGKATDGQMLQAPGLQGGENLPGWRLEEEFLVSAPARRGERGQRTGRKEKRPGKKSQPDGGKLSPGRGK